jgi:Kef-type K+ transport system membrane component KefB
MVLCGALLFMPRVAWAGGGGGGEHGLDLVSAIGIAIIAASFLMLVFNALRLPALLAYIVTGLLMAPLVGPMLGPSIEVMSEVSHLGLVFLLFIIGLEMDIRGILRLGAPTAVAVLLQTPIAVGAILGLQYAALALGFDVPGLGSGRPGFLYFAVACALGSTAVVVKLLGDKFDLDSKAGRITVLTLIAQDIWAVLALSYVASTTGEGGPGIALMLGGGLGVAVAVTVFSRFVLSRIMNTLSRTPDLLALVSIGWCFLCAESFTRVGLSAEMGALVAGLTIGAMPYHVEVLAKVSSLRDFFMALFFVALGTTLPPPTWGIATNAVALVAIVVVVRMALFTPTLFLARLGPIVSFTVPINLAQISEFTLLLVPMGVAAGHLSIEQGAVIFYAMMLSVFVSTFTIGNNYRIARFLARLVPSAKRRDRPSSRADDEEPTGEGESADIVMLGYFLNAEALVAEIEKKSPELVSRFLVIDYNLQNHSTILKHGLRVVYGDISNPETLRHHGIEHARIVISTISDSFLRGTSNKDLALQVRHINPDARFIATAEDERGASKLLESGIFRAVVPPDQAAPVFRKAIEDALEDGSRPSVPTKS